MRAAVFAAEVRWWELLEDVSQSWASRLKRSVWESISGTAKTNAIHCRQSLVLLHSDESKTNWRVKDDAFAATFLPKVHKTLVEASDRSSSNYGPVGASMRECMRNSLNIFLRSFAGIRQTASCMPKEMTLNGDHVCSSNEILAIKLFKRMQESYAPAFHGSSPDDLQVENTNSDCMIHEAFYLDRCQGIGKGPFQLFTNVPFKPKRDSLVSRHHLTRSSRTLTEMCMNNHVQPLIPLVRAFSASTENQFDEDVSDLQSSISGHQQRSTEGQQSSLEVPESKPVSGPSWPNPDNAASYVLMSNIYADGDRWDEVKRINEMRLKARAWKKPGKAYVEIKAKVHEFIVGDRTHQDSTNIYEKLRKIKRHMGHIGYVPYVDLVLENRSYYDPYYKPR